MKKKETSPERMPSSPQAKAGGARRNALLLFSKPPLPGLVKTRLTPLKDGIFSPETAAALYHCMFFDVVECCCAALADLEQEDCEKSPAHFAPNGVSAASSCSAPAKRSVASACSASDSSEVYDLFISTTPPKNVAVMESLFAESGEWPRKLTIIADEGESFDEHYNNAFWQVFERGYDTILSMGGDMPALTKTVVVEGFHQLHDMEARFGKGMVLSPDQEMGVSIVGWTRQTPMDHSGVFYNQEGLTVLPAYLAKARKQDLPVYYLQAVPDVDTMADLMHHITLVEALSYCAQFQDVVVPWRTRDALQQMGYDEVRVAPNDLHDSREGIDIPSKE